MIPPLDTVSAPGDLLELSVTFPAPQDSTVLTAGRLVRLVIPVSFISALSLSVSVQNGLFGMS